MTNEEIIADQYQKYRNLAGDIMKFVSDIARAQNMPLELAILALSVATSTGIRATALQEHVTLPPSFWKIIVDDLRAALDAVESKKT